MTLAQAKRLRSNMTDAERRLWYRFRAHRFAGLKFKRQATIGSYIVDFICFEEKLIIELDGGQHPDNEKDRVRDSWLTNEGYRVMRFWNDDVLKRRNAVLESIAQTVALPQATPLPARASLMLSARHPLPQGERGSCGKASTN